MGHENAIGMWHIGVFQSLGVCDLILSRNTCKFRVLEMRDDPPEIVRESWSRQPANILEKECARS
ncbi:hypothetical protein VQ049_13210, partial [Staphylococcus arlettae]